MNFTKKIDRAFQWAGEKMGQEAKTGHSDEFRNLETEMALRHEGTISIRDRCIYQSQQLTRTRVL